MGEAMPGQGREPIAVVGMACRFPGGIGSTHELWDALMDGADLVSEVPHDRFNINNFYDSDPSKTGVVKTCYEGFVENILSFDAEFFSLFPAHAARIDPQQRLTLEATYHALEDVGLPIENVAGSRTSVFMGAFMYYHLCTQTATLKRENISPHVAMGASTSGMANRGHFSILEEITRAPSDACLNDTKVVQPAIAGIQIALAQLLISYGVAPDAIMGHSIGEVAVAHIVGALALEEAVAVIHPRSAIQSKAAGSGAMLAVGLSAADAK
jgi:acyl transferase domain-containing protein